MDKVVKIVWLINGLFFLILLPAIGWNFFKQTRYPDYETEPESLIVGEELMDAKNKGLAIQGIEYNRPIQINSTNNFILPIYAKTYDHPIDLGTVEDDFESLMEIPATSQPTNYSKLYSNYNYYSSTNWAINILFLDKDYNVTGQLLREKAFIRTFRIPNEDFTWTFEGTRVVDTTVTSLTYMISFNDSNDDGQLNGDDIADLYISDLDGGRFTQVSRDIDIIEHHFMKDNSELLIEYTKRSASKYKMKFFATYDIENRTFKQLDKLHQELKELENSIRK